MAKNRKTAQLLTSLFRIRKVYKTYLAICHGELDKNKGIWKNNLIRYEGKKEINEKNTKKLKIFFDKIEIIQ